MPASGPFRAQRRQQYTCPVALNLPINNETYIETTPDSSLFSSVLASILNSKGQGCRNHSITSSRNHKTGCIQTLRGRNYGWGPRTKLTQQEPQVRPLNHPASFHSGLGANGLWNTQLSRRQNTAVT